MVSADELTVLAEKICVLSFILLRSSSCCGSLPTPEGGSPCLPSSSSEQVGGSLLEEISPPLHHLHRGELADEFFQKIVLPRVLKFFQEGFRAKSIRSTTGTRLHIKPTPIVLEAGFDFLNSLHVRAGVFAQEILPAVTPLFSSPAMLTLEGERRRVCVAVTQRLLERAVLAPVAKTAPAVRGATGGGGATTSCRRGIGIGPDDPDVPAPSGGTARTARSWYAPHPSHDNCGAVVVTSPRLPLTREGWRLLGLGNFNANVARLSAKTAPVVRGATGGGGTTPRRVGGGGEDHVGSASCRVRQL